MGLATCPCLRLPTDSAEEPNVLVSTIDDRPHHWAGRSIETHVKICVQALLLERVAELECGQPWSHIRASLAKLQATRFRSSQHSFFQINSPPSGCRELLKKLATQSPAKVFDIEPLEKQV